MNQEFQDAQCMALCSAGAFPGVPKRKWHKIHKIPMECLSTCRMMCTLICEALKPTKASWWMRLFQYPGHGMRQATSRLWKCRQQNFRNMVFQCAIAILALQISGCKVRKFKIWIFLTSQLAWEEVAPLIFWHLTGLANQTYQSFWEEYKSHVKSQTFATPHITVEIRITNLGFGDAVPVFKDGVYAPQMVAGSEMRQVDFFLDDTWSCKKTFFFHFNRKFSGKSKRSQHISRSLRFV